jgi:putative DNA primase/helicase
MQQVWAQVLDLWRGGEGYYLDSDEVAELNSHNEEFMAIDPTEERILTRFDWKAGEFEWTWMTATEALIAAGVDRPTRADATTAAVIIRKRNNGQARRSNGKSLLLLPPVHR